MCMGTDLSTLRAQRLSTVMPTEAFCRKGTSLHRQRPNAVPANGHWDVRSCHNKQSSHDIVIVNKNQLTEHYHIMQAQIGQIHFKLARQRLSHLIFFYDNTHLINMSQEIIFQ